MTTREELQRELDELRTKVALKQDELNLVKWRPKTLNDTHFILHSGDIHSFSKVSLSSNLPEDNDYGSSFKSEKRAEHAAKIYKRFHLLYKLAEELNDTVRGHPFECWVIEYMGDSKKLVPVRFTEACNGPLPQVKFKTKDLALQAISIILNGGLE